MLDEMRDCATQYPVVLLLNLENQRNNFLKHVRMTLKNSRLVCGKNKLIQKALGTTKELECVEGIHKLAKEVKGESALLFTKDSMEDVMSFFNSYHPEDFAREGAIASESIRLSRGTNALQHLAHSIEAYLRKLGMPTILQEGKIVLLGEYQVCTEGEPISQDQAQVLKLLKRPMARFSINVQGKFHQGKYTPMETSLDSTKTAMEE